ncbi:hypothetical protein IQ06DRAFT_343449 [Phaeosphaeriaceae sp. SRC1lsM3a]|nr:hypothetical protein IQ06DRAFT_343449 [Stagonospora sp. SRC1lsM3a]
MRPLRLLLALSTSLVAVILVLYTVLLAPKGDQLAHTSMSDTQNGFRALLSFTSPGSLFPPSAIISLTDDNSTFFLARPAAFGPGLPTNGLSSALWIGSGFSDDTLAKGELGCSDTDHGPDTDVQSLQESAEIDGKVVLLKRGECGFAEKVLWAQRRGAVAVIVGDNVRGGGLIRMYAQGDTSNITISSLFTSHTTAHLLSSLLPRAAIQSLPPIQAAAIDTHSADTTPISPISTTLPGSTRSSSSTLRTTWRKKWLGLWDANTTESHTEHLPRRSITSITHLNLDSVATSSDDATAHEGLWVTLTPTNVSTSPFFDTLLVLVVSPLVTLTVVYALLLLRSRIRRRRWRAPKSLVERLPVRTYQTISESTSSATPSASSPTTPLLQHSPRQTTTPASSQCPSPNDSPATSSAAPLVTQSREEEKRETGLAQWRRRYGGRQKECVVCLEEYEDGISQVMSLPCGHEFHADCITPWLVTRRRTCPICKGDVVRSLAQSHHNRLPSPSLSTSTLHRGRLADIQSQAAENRNDSPSASLPMPISDPIPTAGSRHLSSDVEANWPPGQSLSSSVEDDGNRSNSFSTSARDLSSTVSTVIWRGVEAVRNTTGLQRRPPEEVDRNR